MSSAFSAPAIPLVAHGLNDAERSGMAVGSTSATMVHPAPGT